MLIGLTLSIALPACSPRPAPIPPPPPPVVIEIKDAPPPELLRCPDKPAPLKLGDSAAQPAQIPPALRQGLIDLARAYRAAVDQLTRLIAWHDPAAPCGADKVP